MADSPTILLVDDEDSVQKLLTYPLERDGFRVVGARVVLQADRLHRAEAHRACLAARIHSYTLPTSPTDRYPTTPASRA